jgi:hypothetical protein
MRLLVALALGLLLAGRMVAAPSPENEIKSRCDRLTGRINAHDIGGIRPLFSPQLRVRGSRGTTRGCRQVLLSMGQTFLRYPKYRTSMKVRKVVVRGDKAYLTADYENKGMRQKEKGSCNMVWKRYPAGWQMVSLDRA